jgi:DNA-binding beta-propeller fold protein YncE
MPSVAVTTRNPRRWRMSAAPMIVSAVAVMILASAAPASAVTPVGHSVSVGLPPTAVAIDAAAHTAYVAVSDGVSDQVAVVDTSHCNGHASSGCGSDVTAVNLESGAGASGLVYDAANHTVYVADANSGDVSMINASTCNASTTTSCAAAPKIAALNLTAPSAVAVDTSGGNDVFYVADSSAGTVTVVDAATCSATKTTGCGITRTANVGSAPSAISVDPAAGTTYVALLGDDSVTTLKESACSKLTAACDTIGKTVSLGAGTSPSALAADPAVNTLFVADSGTDAVSFVNTAKCNISVTTGCTATPRSQGGPTAPAGLALTSTGRVAVADSGDGAILVVNGATCNATKTTGCLAAEIDPLAGSPVAVATDGSSVYAADSTNSSLDVVAIPTIRASVKSKHAKTKFGWYRSPVTVTFSCAAGSVPLTGTCPSAVTIKKNGKNRSVTKTVASSDGGSASVTVAVNLDQRKPTVKVTGVKNGKTYSKAPTLRCKAHDALSGIASCHIKRSHHGHEHKYVATAKDRAGNVASVHGKYRVA